MKKGVTQDELCADTELSQSAISNWELGNKKPSMDALITLADYFDVTIDWLVGRIPK
ncbi:MAG: helix-turn-helix domain-containing protein [Firmicutes bacterium]|nr:helix-turn-helix domain-containing protein [Bacillota bacterium]